MSAFEAASAACTGLPTVQALTLEGRRWVVRIFLRPCLDRQSALGDTRHSYTHAASSGCCTSAAVYMRKYDSRWSSAPTGFSSAVEDFEFVNGTAISTARWQMRR